MRKEKNIAVERERLKKLNADRKAREEEASLTKKDQGLPRKSLLMRYETKGNADVAEEADGEDAYDDDEDFYSEDEFENEEVANDPMEESVSSKAERKCPTLLIPESPHICNCLPSAASVDVRNLIISDPDYVFCDCGCM